MGLNSLIFLTRPKIIELEKNVLFGVQQKFLILNPILTQGRGDGKRNLIRLLLSDLCTGSSALFLIGLRRRLPTHLITLFVGYRISQST